MNTLLKFSKRHTVSYLKNLGFTGLAMLIVITYVLTHIFASVTLSISLSLTASIISYIVHYNVTKENVEKI